MKGTAQTTRSLPVWERSLEQVFRRPVPAESRRLLKAAWDRLPSELQTPNQFLGRQYAGCGATIGLMPRCDFACRGCYLGAEANIVPAKPVDEIKHQLRRLRAWLGEGGNVQLTDGEVTLRREDELIELIAYARRIGLVPMVMSHGDSFRRDPGLLRRLMEQAGLTELSIHIDTTQRGRLGAAYKKATTEAALMPLREEFAEMIRDLRRRTGRTLEVATTFTVTEENMNEVPDVIRWLLWNADVFKMIGFLPVAQVGRTQPGLGKPAVAEELWARVTQGLGKSGDESQALLEDTGWLGHPACSRFLQGLVVVPAGAGPRFHSLFRRHDTGDQAVLQDFLDRFGSLTFRLDTRKQALARLAGLIWQDPDFFLRQFLPHLLRWLRRLDPDRPVRLLRHWLRGRTRVNYLNIVSHHFMSREEIETPLGQERLRLCAFRVPIGDQLMSMCQVNAQGIRDRYYETGV